MAISDPNFANTAQAPWLRRPPHQWQPNTLDRAVLHAHAETLRLTPGFESHCAAFAENTLATFESNWALNKLMREAPRFALAAFVIYLHHYRGRGELGVTYSRIQELFAKGSRTGILASPTRIKAMLGIARVAGQLRQAPASVADRRLKILEPTEKLIAPSRVWLHGCLNVVARAMPLAQPPAALMAIPEFLGEVMSYNVLAYLHDGFVLYEECPAVQYFMSREKGYLTVMQIVHTLHFDCQAWHAQVPSVKLAKRFSLSRSAVRNLLTDAGQRGWLKVAARGGHALVLSEDFAAQCQRWVALEFVWTAGFANAAAHRLDSTAVSPTPTE